MDVDAIVIGGGPAGLSAALQLARWNRSVLVLDTDEGRSTHNQVNHNYLGFVDGVAARDLRDLGRRQLAHYPHVTLLRQRATSASRTDGGFVVEADGEQHRGRVVVLATGVVDDYPSFDDSESFIGRSMFWCITCDGYECRQKRVVVVGGDEHAAAEALQLVSLGSRITLLTDAPAHPFGEDVRQRLEDAGVTVVEGRFAGAVGSDGLMTEVHTDDGRSIAADAVFVIRPARPTSALADQLGVEVDGKGYVVVDAEQQTSVPGVLAAGDLTSLHSHQVSAAVHEGAQAASAANYLLYPDRLRVS